MREYCAIPWHIQGCEKSTLQAIERLLETVHDDLPQLLTLNVSSIVAAIMASGNPSWWKHREEAA